MIKIFTAVDVYDRWFVQLCISTLLYIYNCTYLQLCIYWPTLNLLQSYIKIQDDWNTHVQSTVPKDKLLVFNAKEGWGPLCAFLHVPIPDKKSIKNGIELPPKEEKVLEKEEN